MPAWSESDDPLQLAATAHARLDAWRQAHPRATLREIELEVDRQLAAARTGVIERLAQHGAEDARPACPTCGRLMQQVGERERTVRTAQDQRLTVRGPGYRCPACGTGLFPPG